MAWRGGVVHTEYFALSSDIVAKHHKFNPQRSINFLIYHNVVEIRNYIFQLNLKLYYKSTHVMVSFVDKRTIITDVIKLM